MLQWAFVTGQGGRAEIVRRLARLGSRVLDWHDRALQRRRLADLEPWLLRDLGLTPADVRRESAKPFWQL
jgi:uncharacterized protein YjiS (DUF1127 family)